MTIAIVVLSVILLVALVSLICFFMVFYSPKREMPQYPMPLGKVYEPYYDEMRGWQEKVDSLPHRDVEIKSHDGLTLRGKYYQYSPDAPMELMFHGYRGSSRSDLCGGILRCFKLGRSVLVVDHRASGESEGKVITFGVKESLDCRRWVDFVTKHINPDAKIMLTGISMGAATVMIASAFDLPHNVIGVVADCGYTSPRAIIKKVARNMKLPADLVYPFVRLGARLYGGFDPDSISPVEALKKAKVPVIFIHGDTDAFVPYEMSEENYKVCSSRKRLVKIKGAGHGLAYAVDPDLYLEEITKFFEEK